MRKRLALALPALMTLAWISTAAPAAAAANCAYTIASVTAGVDYAFDPAGSCGTTAGSTIEFPNGADNNAGNKNTAQGNVRFGSGNTDFTYKANAAGVGPDTFTLLVTLGPGAGTTIEVTVQTIAGPPVLSAFTASSVGYGASGNAINVATGGNVKRSPNSYSVAASPAGPYGPSAASANGGSVTINSSGAATYAAPAGFRGNDTFYVKASNGSGDSSATAVTVPVGNPTLSATLTGSGAKGVALSGVSVVPSGGKSPYTCATSLASGALPSGTAIGSNCAITGTPSASGTFNFTVNLTDSATGTGPYTMASPTLSLVISAPAPVASSFTYGSLVAYNAGGAGATSINVSGHATNSPTSYAVGSATTAQGGSVSINSAGLASYTPPAGYRGNDSFTFTASNPGGTSSPATVTATVADPVLSTSLSSSSGTQGAALSGVAVNVSGGKAPYSCATSVASGALPSGVSIGADCALTGTPSTSGTFNFTVNITDSTTGTGPYTQASSALTLTIASASPTVTSVSPTAGPETGGTTVTVTGTNFTSAMAVTFGATAATGYTVNSATLITATAPAGVGMVDIRVTTGLGTSPATPADQYTYVAAPTVTSISPTAGPAGGGTTVTITGTRLSGATAVTFGGAAATGYTVNSATQITATAPAGSGTVDVRVTTVGGTSATSAADQFTYVPGPTVSAISPSAGSTAGGTSVVITGSNLSGATAVTFGGTAATGFVVNSATQITATSPADAAGTVDIRVTTEGGTSPTSAADQFTYATTPAVTAISPTAGPTSGGASVVITGTGFTGVNAVSFGGTAATGFVVNSATQITATSPAGAAGTVDIVVSNAGGTSATSAADHYTYVVAPTVSSVSPAAGPGTGGTSVVITGSDLSGATAVTFGGAAATGFTVNSATQITATAPAGAGTVDVRVTTVGGTSATSAGDQFTYIGAPSISGVSPSAGPLSGGATVVISGSGFTDATAVTFGATAATGFTVNSATQITATTPAGTGTVDIRVTTVGGTSATSAADQYTYVAAPSVTSISPTAGPTSGGTTVTITGANLSSATAVTFGGAAATGFIVNSATQITATAPAGTGTVDVRVTTVGGTSATSAADQFSYVAGPGVGSVSPSAGPTTGGTTVIVNGTGFSGATAVTFGATAATGYTVNSDTQITATAPAGTGTVDIRVTTIGGTTPTGGGDHFTYAPAPTVSGLSVSAGPTTGGASVGISGTGFFGATSVTFGGVAVTSFMVQSDTQITATTPTHAAGPVTIAVTTPGGTGSFVNAYAYVVLPSVSGLSPNAGPVAGGTSVVLTGANLTGATAVKFGAANATSFTVNSDTQITATTPAQAAGAVTVSVTTSGGVSVVGAGNSFTFAAVPSVTSLTPAVGPPAGGTSVLIAGAGFTGASVVKFGSVNATSFTVDSDTRITAVAPAGAIGRVDLTVTTAGGTSTAVAYEYAEPAQVVVSASAPGGQVGASYVGRIQASGGAAPYAFSVTAGALPPGIVLGADGALSGTPTTAGDYAATLTATDADGVTGSASITVSIRSSVLTLTGGIPSGVDGVAYSAGFTVSGGVAPYRFSLTGALPPGLAFDAATGALSGAPTGEGAFAFTVTVTDSSPGQPLTASQSASITVAPAAPPTAEPVVVNKGAVDQPVTIDLSDKVQGDYTNVVILRQPQFGRVSVQSSGVALTRTASPRIGSAAAPTPTTFALIYTPNPGYDGPDSFTYAAVGPGGQSPAARIVIGALPVPVAVADTATTASAKPLVIDLTDNDQGVFDGVAIVDAPANGQVIIDGLKVTYTSKVGFSGVDTFTYTVTGPGGVSAKAEVRVSVTAQVSAAPPISVTVMAGQAAVVDLTNGATGGPFTGAAVVSVSPSDAGPATIASPSAGRYVLTFMPAATFSGAAVIKYTISNAAAVSAPGQVTVTVTPRPDPTQDADVRGLVAAQGATARRFATAQIGNFNRRLEQLHNGGGAGRAFGMTLQGGVTDRMDGVEAREAMRKRAAFTAPNDDIGTLRPAEARAAAVIDGPESQGGEGGQPKRWGFWAAGAADVGLREAFTGQKGFRFTTDGLTLGADYRLSPRLAIGGGVGYGHDATKVGHDGTKSEADSVSAAAYASFQPTEHGFIDAVVGYGGLNFDTRRHVTATGDLVSGQRDGQQLFASVTAGVEHRQGALMVSPYGRAGLTRSTLDAYSETGGGLWALSYQRQQIDSLTGALGLRASYRYKVSIGELSPRLRVEYSHDFEGAETAGIQYADWRKGPVYRLAVDGVDRDLARIELGFDLRMRSGWRLGMDFDNALGSTTQSHGVRLSVDSAF